MAQKSRDPDGLYTLEGTDIEVPPGKSPPENSNLLLTFLMLLSININILSTVKIIAPQH